jgi:hypothetical protein
MTQGHGEASEVVRTAVEQLRRQWIEVVSPMGHTRFSAQRKREFQEQRYECMTRSPAGGMERGIRLSEQFVA